MRYCLRACLSFLERPDVLYDSLDSAGGPVLCCHGGDGRLGPGDPAAGSKEKRKARRAQEGVESQAGRSPVGFPGLGHKRGRIARWQAVGRGIVWSDPSLEDGRSFEDLNSQIGRRLHPRPGLFAGRKDIGRGRLPADVLDRRGQRKTASHLERATWAGNRSGLLARWAAAGHIQRRRNRASLEYKRWPGGAGARRTQLSGPGRGLFA